MLGKALQLEAFGVVGKPVNMDILQQLLNRLFREEVQQRSLCQVECR